MNQERAQIRLKKCGLSLRIRNLKKCCAFSKRTIKPIWWRKHTWENAASILNFQIPAPEKHFIWIGGNFFLGLVVINYTLLVSGSKFWASLPFTQPSNISKPELPWQNLIERSVPRISKTISWGCKQNLHSFEALCNTKHRWTGKHPKNQNTLKHERLLDVGCNYLVPFTHKCAMARIFW